MKLGIMQPYFFPYLGYFDLIHSTDRWIVFDTPQYIRHGWVNRNRILHPTSGWQYVTVPVKKHSRNTPICDIRMSEDDAWKSRILGQLEHYRKRAPFFEPTIDLVQDCLKVEETLISRLNGEALEKVCNALGVPFEYDYFSTMDLDIGEVNGPGEWALRISEALGATEYINPEGGAGLFDPDEFEKAGVRLKIRSFPNLEYNCPGYQFEPGLSIIDVMMWVPPDEIREYLDARSSEST